MDADPDYIANSPLRAAFESKSKGFSKFMKDIPIFILRDKEPAFNGLKYDLKRHLGIQNG
jgi:glucokinase